ncbi:hypothetical protein GCM10019059_34930 [Camelimonas fluminis]|uniref:Uncharacterized protein n=1 Tax=Camelimonas fluminis TaxID=1576911 RepID=A0ABV7UGJ2_9HYPH|nr:hypothetical protein [Camelimonas fluminis]GHE72297.1 hypothetical protein GCM10019059_34930 [Camelimonas fluminis]
MSAIERKPYKVTDKAGFWVAGQKLPTDKGEDGIPKPRVGYVLHLTEDEAKHELAAGVIEPGASAGA